MTIEWTANQTFQKCSNHIRIQLLYIKNMTCKLITTLRIYMAVFCYISSLCKSRTYVQRVDFIHYLGVLTTSHFSLHIEQLSSHHSNCAIWNKHINISKRMQCTFWYSEAKLNNKQNTNMLVSTSLTRSTRFFRQNSSILKRGKIWTCHFPCWHCCRSNSSQHVAHSPLHQSHQFLHLPIHHQQHLVCALHSNVASLYRYYSTARINSQTEKKQKNK